MAEHKITTHTLGNGWFTAEIDGVPLLGPGGGFSRFPSRKDAREAAQHRLNQLTPDDLKELGLTHE